MSACPPDDKSASKLDHLADQWKTENTPPDVTNSGRKFWTSSTTFKGNKVFQRNDLIDPKLVDARGRTNLERMQKGLAPADLDGKSVNLHHMTQKHNGSIAEVTQIFHQKNSKTIHINPSSTPSGIDRSAFNKWRIDYWKSRANDF
ncbi:TPA: HNH/ENDO VII family nuclease [Photobacterium damselae]|uniref:HNH/ENDO VII family nuclease n=1 Tax=Photobacterium damselae TaxID=38293 RepID=UPI0023D91846|nr:HNH/ENDO VII family nuclease [Photobacterium damselae]